MSEALQAKLNTIVGSKRFFRQQPSPQAAPAATNLPQAPDPGSRAAAAPALPSVPQTVYPVSPEGKRDVTPYQAGAVDAPHCSKDDAIEQLQCRNRQVWAVLSDNIGRFLALVLNVSIVTDEQSLILTRAVKRIAASILDFVSVMSLGKLNIWGVSKMVVDQFLQEHPQSSAPPQAQLDISAAAWQTGRCLDWLRLNFEWKVQKAADGGDALIIAPLAKASERAKSLFSVLANTDGMKSGSDVFVALIVATYFAPDLAYWQDPHKANLLIATVIKSRTAISELEKEVPSAGDTPFVS